MRFGRARRPDPLIDVSPMIDIVFQLVLFFMVSTTFITSSPGIEVDLPRAADDRMLTDREDVSIWVTADGAIYVDEDPVDLRGLRERLSRAASADPSTLVVIKADGGVSHGRVVTVMDLARGLGLNRLAIATEAPTGDGGGETP